MFEFSASHPPDLHPDDESVFKVLANVTEGQARQIVLLEVPEIHQNKLLGPILTPWETHLATSGRDKFLQARRVNALPELRHPSWLNRLKDPLVIDDEGEFFEAWYPDAH